MLGIRIRIDLEAAAGLEARDVVELTERATHATFYEEGLTAEQQEANRRIPQLSGQVFFLQRPRPRHSISPPPLPASASPAS